MPLRVPGSLRCFRRQKGSPTRALDPQGVLSGGRGTSPKLPGLSHLGTAMPEHEWGGLTRARQVQAAPIPVVTAMVIEGAEGSSQGLLLTGGLCPPTLNTRPLAPPTPTDLLVSWSLATLALNGSSHRGFLLQASFFCPSGSLAAGTLAAASW